jgi:hypothetical protein
MTAMVDGDYPEVFSEQAERAGPVEAGAGTQAMQQHQNRGAGGAGNFPDVGAPPSGQFHRPPGWNIGPIDCTNHCHD